MPTRKRASYVNPQERAAEFQVGQSVTHWGHPVEEAGRVTAVWPAIGQVDVQFPWGNLRIPAEDLQIISDASWIVTPQSQDEPGGGSITPVSGGPFARKTSAPEKNSSSAPAKAASASPDRVVVAYVKRAIYWQEKNRKYRVSQGELDSGSFNCPRCKETILRDAIYKREEGQSVRLLGCPSCLFLVKREDLLGIETPSEIKSDVVLPSGKSELIRLLRGE